MEAAARRYPPGRSRCTWIVANADRFVPYAGRSFSLVLSITGRMNAGVLLQDPATDRLWVRLRRDWDQFAPDEAEVLSAIEYDLAGG